MRFLVRVEVAEIIYAVILAYVLLTRNLESGSLSAVSV
jgi:hypothetical protein